MKLCDQSCESHREATESFIDNLVGRLIHLSCAIAAGERINPARQQDIDDAIVVLRNEVKTTPTPAPAISLELLLRLRQALAFGEQRKYLAVPIDLEDVRAIVAAMGGAP